MIFHPWMAEDVYKISFTSVSVGVSILHILAKRVEAGSDKPYRTQEEWENFKEKHSDRTYTDVECQNFLKWGHPTGKKYAVKTDYGDWDSEFTMEKLESVLKAAYQDQPTTTE